MSSTAWIQTLFTGAVGSALGLVGVYIAFRLNSRNDRREAKEERTAGSIAQLIVAANDLAKRDLSGKWWGLEGSLAEFSLAAQLFAAREARDHPEVAGWTIQQAQRLGPELRRRQRHAPLFMRPRTIVDLVGMMGRVTGTLIDWRVGNKPASWFAADLARLEAEGIDLASRTAGGAAL